MKDAPESFLGSISNNLALVDASASSYACVLRAFKSLDFFGDLSDDNPGMLAVLAIQAEDYNQAIKLISYNKSSGLNLPLVKLF